LSLALALNMCMRWTLAWDAVTYRTHTTLFLAVGECGSWSWPSGMADDDVGESAGGEGGCCVILMWALGQKYQYAQHVEQILPHLVLVSPAPCQPNHWPLIPH
jgi:hypothetical protein